MQSIHPVSFTGTIFFVAFDRAAAEAVSRQTDDEYQCQVTDISDLPLIDNYGFHCRRADAGVLFPWLGEVQPEIAETMLTAPFYMTESERDAADFAERLAEHEREQALWTLACRDRENEL